MKRGKPEPDDWITYLTALMNTNVSFTVVLFSSLILISVVVFQLYNAGSFNRNVAYILILFELALFTVFLIRFNRAIKYQRLLHRIMNSEFRTHKEILDVYLKIVKIPKKF